MSAFLAPARILRSALPAGLSLLTIALVSAQSLVSSDPLIYDLHSHPAGAGSPPVYGLRVDDLGGYGGVFTFDFDDPRGGGMQLIYDPSANSIRIVGSAYGGLNAGDGYADESTGLVGVWDIDFIYAANVTAMNLGDPENLMLEVNPFDNANNNGTVGLQGSGTAFTFVEKPLGATGTTFQMNPDGFGIPGDSSTLVGRGWLQDHLPRAAVQDWLFTATLIPEPSSVMLLGLGGLLLLRRRR